MNLDTFRLPKAFSHWTYTVTGGSFMIVDIEGWKLDLGQYIMTDPIIFSYERFLLGKVD